jgi:exonuclease 3'-5' domain-containing protein 1
MSVEVIEVKFGDISLRSEQDDKLGTFKDEGINDVDESVDVLNSRDSQDSKGVTLVASLVDLDYFQQLVKNQLVIAFDAEGVNLSRLGDLTVVSIGVRTRQSVHVFLFDMITDDIELKTSQLTALKVILEDSSVEKIVHDCRQDSDALFTQADITLTNVFDSSIYVMRANKLERRLNLNNSLKLHDCLVNENRDDSHNIYKDNPTFWNTRPLTPFMIQYASKDVASLFDLRDKLLVLLAETQTTEEFVAIQTESNKVISEYRGLTLYELVPVPPGCIGCIIGKGGAGIAKIEKRSGAMLSCCLEDSFLVLGDTQSKINKAKHEMMKSYERFI